MYPQSIPDASLIAVSQIQNHFHTIPKTSEFRHYSKIREWNVKGYQTVQMNLTLRFTLLMCPQPSSFSFVRRVHCDSDCIQIYFVAVPNDPLTICEWPQRVNNVIKFARVLLSPAGYEVCAPQAATISNLSDNFFHILVILARLIFK